MAAPISCNAFEILGWDSAKLCPFILLRSERSSTKSSSASLDPFHFEFYCLAPEAPEAFRHSKAIEPCDAFLQLNP